MNRIEISLKSHLPDPRGLGLVKDVYDLGITAISDIRVVDVCWLDADLSHRTLDNVCSNLLADPAVMPQLNVVLYYADEQGNTTAGYPHNPNGSMNNIAGICDTSGRIFALMPHPERHIRGTQHPGWTRLGAQQRGDGFQIFLNAVKWAEGL